MRAEHGGGPDFGPEIEQISLGQKREISGSKSTIGPDIALTMTGIARKFDMLERERWVEEGLDHAEKWANRSTDPRKAKMGNPRESVKLYRYLNILQKSGASFLNRKALSPLANTEISEVPIQNIHSKPIPPRPGEVREGLSEIRNCLKAAAKKDAEKKKGPLPDRPAELDLKDFTSIDHVLTTILKRVNEKPQDVSFDDLTKIVEAERLDSLTQQDSFERISEATKVAEEYLEREQSQKKVHIALYKDQNMQWIARPHTGGRIKLYHTFTREDVLRSGKQLDAFTLHIDFLAHAHRAARRIAKGEEIEENDEELQALNVYLWGKTEELKHASQTTHSPDLKKKATACFRIFDILQQKVNGYEHILAGIEE